MFNLEVSKLQTSFTQSLFLIHSKCCAKFADMRVWSDPFGKKKDHDDDDDL